MPAAGGDDATTRVLRIGLAAGLGLVVVQSISGLVIPLEFHSYHSLIDLDRNNSIPDIISTAIIGCGSFGAAVLASRVKRRRWLPAALAAVLMLVAAADALHVGVDRHRASGVLLLGTLALTAVLTVGVALDVPRAPRVSLLVGLCLLMVAVEAAAWYDEILERLDLDANERRGYPLYELGIVGKQGLELGGFALIAIGLWAAALGPTEDRPPARASHAVEARRGASRRPARPRRRAA